MTTAVARPKTKSEKPTTKPTPKSEIVTPWPRPIAIVGYGPPGVGKTSLFARFPDAFVAYDPNETGIVDLVDWKQIPAPRQMRQFDTFQELINIADNAYELSKQGIKTFVVDSLTGVENLCFKAHCEEYFEGDWSKKGFFSYQQGPKNAARTDWPRLLNALNCFTECGISVVLVAHSQIKTFQNPEGPDYDRFSPCLDKETWNQTHRWAKAVLLYKYAVDTTEDKSQGTKTKAQSSVSRVIMTEWSPTYDAKNRYGLPPIIFAGDSSEEAYQALANAFPKI